MTTSLEQIMREEIDAVRAERDALQAKLDELGELSKQEPVEYQIYAEIWMAVEKSIFDNYPEPDRCVLYAAPVALAQPVNAELVGALEKSAACIQALADGTNSGRQRADWGNTLDVIDNALANAKVTPACDMGELCIGCTPQCAQDDGRPIGQYPGQQATFYSLQK